MSATRRSHFVAALEEELSALATSALGVPSVTVGERHATPPGGMEGAYLGLVGEGSCQIGLASSDLGCQMLARGLLMEAEGVTLPAADVADAVCEIVNMLAGGVQRQMRKRTGVELTLGLPTFFHGAVQPTERLAVAVSDVRLGDVPAALLLLYPRRGAEEA